MYIVQLKLVYFAALLYHNHHFNNTFTSTVMMNSVKKHLKEINFNICTKNAKFNTATI